MGFCFCNEPCSWLIFKNIKKSPLLKLKIRFFTLLHIYIVLHSHVKSCKHVYFYIYIVLWDCVKLYKHIIITLTLFCTHIYMFRISHLPLHGV